MSKSRSITLWWVLTLTGIFALAFGIYQWINVLEITQNGNLPFRAEGLLINTGASIGLGLGVLLSSSLLRIREMTIRKLESKVTEKP